jgi:ABC-type transport system involved in multi-copper enzyme maturation permease subunit
MGPTILKREIQHNLYSLRFIVALALVLLAFILGAISFVRNHEDALAKDRLARADFLDKMKADAAKSATGLAVTRRDYPLRPRDNGFIYDAKEKYLPDAITFSAWNVFGFRNRGGSINPFLAKHDEINWSFIVGLILSFVALLFTFDAVSGEKEARTLALALSNPISRGALLFWKYLSAIVSFVFVVTPGILASLLVVLVLGAADVSASLAAEVAGFLAVSVLLAASFAAFGLLSSVVSRSANVSLLLALSFWLLFAVVIPNSSAFSAKRLFPIESAEAVQTRVTAALGDLSRNAPPGSWSMNQGNPFMPLHELRANLQMKRLQAEKAIRDAAIQAMSRQFEKTRLLATLSPVTDFEGLTEAVVGGGYPRLLKVWKDLHVYQGRLLTFFQALDARDAKSPHWYNPNEDVSTTRLPVAFETVPQFVEKPMSFAERFRPAIPYLIMSAAITSLVFALSFFLFVRYDVR